MHFTHCLATRKILGGSTTLHTFHYAKFHYNSLREYDQNKTFSAIYRDFRSSWYGDISVRPRIIANRFTCKQRALKF